MDEWLTTFIGNNTVTIIAALYFSGGIASALEGITGQGMTTKILRNVGHVLGKLVDIFEGTIDAIKPKRIKNGGSK